MDSSLVLDAGAFYAGTAFQSSAEKLYTTPLVLSEVEHIKSKFAAIDALRDSGRLEVIEPRVQFIERARGAAVKVGVQNILSAADLSIIALALQLKTTLVTDDYGVTNVAGVIGLQVRSATAEKGIREMRRWIFYCLGCNRTFNGSTTECPLCGNKLRRKYRKIKSDI